MTRKLGPLLNKAKIILLNGTSSSGKSTLAQALQERLETPYLHFCIDVFEDMVPRKWAGMQGKVGGEILGRLLTAFHRSVAVTAACGNDLILDTVLIEDEEHPSWVTECMEQIEPFDVLKVGVFCSLEESERRELQRGDRGIGLARWQADHMHRQVAYDLTVDTSVETTEESVDRIVRRLGH